MKSTPIKRHLIMRNSATKYINNEIDKLKDLSNQSLVTEVKEMFLSIVYPVVLPHGMLLSAVTKQVKTMLEDNAKGNVTFNKEIIVSDLFQQFKNSTYGEELLGNYAQHSYIPNFEESLAVLSGKIDPKHPFVNKYINEEIDKLKDLEDQSLVAEVKEVFLSCIVYPMFLPCHILLEAAQKQVEVMLEGKVIVNKESVMSDLFKRFKTDFYGECILFYYAGSGYIPNFEESLGVLSGKIDPKQPFIDLFARSFDDVTNFYSKFDIFNEKLLMPILISFYQDPNDRFSLSTFFTNKIVNGFLYHDRITLDTIDRIKDITSSALPRDLINKLIEALDENYQKHIYVESTPTLMHLENQSPKDPEAVTQSTLTQYARDLVNTKIRSNFTEAVEEAVVLINAARSEEGKLPRYCNKPPTEKEIKAENPEIYEQALALKLLLDTPNTAISEMDFPRLVAALSDTTVLAKALDPTLRHLFLPTPPSAAAAASVEIEEILSEPQSSQTSETPPEEMKSVGEYVDQAD